MLIPKLWFFLVGGLQKGKSYGSKRTQDKCDKQEESIMQ